MLVLALILIFYLILGCVMDSLSMILLTIPIFFPIIESLDFGMTQEMTAIWFWNTRIDCRGGRVNYTSCWHELIYYPVDGQRHSNTKNLSGCIAIPA